MKTKKLYFLLIVLLILTNSLLAKALKSERCFNDTGAYGAVSTGHPLATRAAIKVLRNGGNAVDAAVAAGFMLGVVDFSNSGIGGDGYALIHTPTGQIQAWDGSIKRPRHLSKNAGDHPLGLPAVPELLLKLLRHYGSRSIAEIMAPAISTCQKGFKLSAYLEKTIEKKLPSLTDQAAIKFLAPDGFPLRAGQVLQQPILAETLMQLARDEGQSFYRGKTAQVIINNMQQLGSEYGLADMATLRSTPSRPIKYDWQGYSLYGTPPPSSSVATIKLAIDLLKRNYDLFSHEADEIIKIASLGQKVIGVKYSGVAASNNNPNNFATLVDAAKSADSSEVGSDGLTNTTHLCVWDRNGMVVSMTLTLGSHFGTGELSPAGFFYNNGMRNFSRTVGGYPVDYSVKAGPVSAKSPIIVTHDHKPWLAIGGAGSNRIIFNTALAIARCIAAPQSFYQLAREPRFFLDYKDKLFLEWNPDRKMVADLQSKYPNFELKPGADDYFGLVSAIMASASNLVTFADHRRDGSCQAIAEDMDKERNFELEMIINSRRPFTKLEIAAPVSNDRQKAGPIDFKAPVKAAKQSGNRIRILNKNKSNSAILKMTLNINNSPPASVAASDPTMTFAQSEPGPKLKAFADRYGKNMSATDLVRAALVDVTFTIPYQKVKLRTSSEKMLAMGYGDCSGKARLMNDLLRLRGINSRLVGGLIFQPGLKSVTHLWLEAELDGKWQPICPVNSFFGHIPSNWIIFRYNEERMTSKSAQVIFNLKETKP